MRNRDVRVACMLDSHRAKIYRYENGEIGFETLTGEVPRRVRRLSEDNETRHVVSQHNEHAHMFLRVLTRRLEGATAIVLLGPGKAKDQLANRLRAMPRFAQTTLQVVTSEWLADDVFESFARALLQVDPAAPTLYLRAPEFTPHWRLGGPGAPVSQEHYERTNELKPKNGLTT